MTNEIFGESDMCFQYGKSSDGELFMISNIPFTVSLWTPGDSTTYSKGSLVTPDDTRTINPTVTFSFPAGATTVDAMMSVEFEQQIYDHLEEKGYRINPKAAVPSVDEVAQARQRVEGVDFSKALNQRPQSVDDLNPNRKPQPAGNIIESADELQTMITAVERVESKKKPGNYGYRLYRDSDQGLMSCGYVWLDHLVEKLEAASTDDLSILKVGMRMPVEPFRGWYRKGKQTEQGGQFNDFLRFEQVA
jgi:hypothetical protein